MPSALSLASQILPITDLIKKDIPAILLQTKVIKVGTFLESYHTTHPDMWSNSSGSYQFTLQDYLADYLQQYGLTFTVNGNNQVEVIAWP